MARYTKTTVSSVSGVNSELDKISTALNDMLDREGATPNQMEVDLDMNSNDILNASTVYTQNLAIDGALVSTSEPVAAVQTVTTETATATAGQTLFNLSNEYVAGANTLTVFVNGVKMRLNADYTETSSSSVTFTSGLSLNDIVEFYIGRYVTDATLYDSDAVTYDPPFTGSTATTVETKLSETVSVKDFGAVGDGVTDDTAAIQAAIDTGLPVYLPTGTYKTTDQIELNTDGNQFVGDGYNSVIKLTGTFSSTTAALIVPGNGDNFGGTANGGQNTYVHNIRLDGSAAIPSGGARIYGYVNAYGTGHRVGTLWAHEFDKTCVSTQSVGSNEIGIVYDDLRLWGATGSGAIGYGQATNNDDETRVIVKSVISYDHAPSGTGIGVNFSTGSCSVGKIKTWNCGAGGAKIAGGDTTQIVNIDEFESYDHTNTSAQGFYTNGSFKSLSINRAHIWNTAAQGIAVNHAGRVHIGYANMEDIGSIGLHVFSGDPTVTFGCIEVNNAGTHAISHANGKLIGGSLTSRNCGRFSLNCSSLGVTDISSITSIDDCTDGVTNASVNIQPTSNPEYVRISSTYSSDASTNVTNAVSVSANLTHGHIGSVRISGNVSNAVSDSGTDTQILDAEQDYQFGTSSSRLGFYGTARIAQQTGVSVDAAGIHAALVNLGLITA